MKLLPPIVEKTPGFSVLKFLLLLVILGLVGFIVYNSYTELKTVAEYNEKPTSSEYDYELLSEETNENSLNY